MAIQADHTDERRQTIGSGVGTAREVAAAGADGLEVYEQLVADSVQIRHAVGFGYARIALWSILSALGLRAGDRILLSPLTCKVVPLVLRSLELEPCYVDISASTLNLDPDRLSSLIDARTKVILFQHTYGSSAGIEAVAQIAEQKRLFLIEDCAQCLPYSAQRPVPGHTGHAAIFSNNLLKPLPAASGGLAVMEDDALAAAVRELRNALPHPSRLSRLMLHLEVWSHRYLLQPSLYWPLYRLHRQLAGRSQMRSLDVEIANEITSKAQRISDYQVQRGIDWMKRIDSVASHRRSCCREYSSALRTAEKVLLPVTGTEQPLYYFPVLVERKQELLRRAQRRYVEIIAWPISTPIYPVEEKQNLLLYGYVPGSCPTAERVASQLVGLPTHGKITAHERERIVDLLASVEGLTIQ